MTWLVTVFLLSHACASVASLTLDELVTAWWLLDKKLPIRGIFRQKFVFSLNSEHSSIAWPYSSFWGLPFYCVSVSSCSIRLNILLTVAATRSLLSTSLAARSVFIRPESDALAALRISDRIFALPK